jgi:hypothetical protein
MFLSYRNPGVFYEFFCDERPLAEAGVQLGNSPRGYSAGNIRTVPGVSVEAGRITAIVQGRDIGGGRRPGD